MSIHTYSKNKFKLEITAKHAPKSFKAQLILYTDGLPNTLVTLNTVKIFNSNGFIEGEINGYAEKCTLYVNKERYFFVIDTGLNKIDLNFKANGKIDFTTHSTHTEYLNKVLRYDMDMIKTKNYTLVDSVFHTLLEHKESYAALLEFNFFIHSVFGYKFPEKAFSCFKQFSSNLCNSELGKRILQELEAKTSIRKSIQMDQSVPIFKVKTFEGKGFSNQDLLGKPYIIAFSATWCGPCMAMQPKLLALYHKYQSQGLKVIYFNLDDNQNIWAKHIKDKNLDWINVSEGTKFKDSKIAAQFFTNAIPRYLIIDKTGKIIYDADQIDYNYEKLEQYIQKVL